MEQNICRNCENYHQHFVQRNDRFAPLKQGHCSGFSKYRTANAEFSACENFILKEAEKKEDTIRHLLKKSVNLLELISTEVIDVDH